ncbi:MAG: branched-chain amino acid ABC transporter permease [Candidatus Bathyarchaeia archaeon]
MFGANKRYTYTWMIVYAFLILLSLTSGGYAEVVYNIAFLMVLSQSLNIAMGFGGLVNLGFVSFLGVGAYVFAVLVVYGLNPYLSMLTGGFVAIIVALPIGMVVLRLRGPFFAICTLSLIFAAKYFFLGTGIGGGYYGITLYKYIGSLYNNYVLAYILLALSAVLTMLTNKLRRSSLGYSLMAIREDEDTAQTMGVDTFKSKLIAYAISAFFPGIVGGVFAFKIFWVLPDRVFNPFVTIEAVLTLLMGGAGSVTGPLIGALIYELMKDTLLRIPGLQGMQMPIFGILVIIIAISAPQGVVGLIKSKYRKLQDFII